MQPPFLGSQDIVLAPSPIAVVFVSNVYPNGGSGGFQKLAILATMKPYSGVSKEIDVL